MLLFANSKKIVKASSARKPDPDCVTKTTIVSIKNSIMDFLFCIASTAIRQ